MGKIRPVTRHGPQAASGPRPGSASPYASHNIATRTPTAPPFDDGPTPSHDALSRLWGADHLTKSELPLALADQAIAVGWSPFEAG